MFKDVRYNIRAYNGHVEHGECHPRLISLTAEIQSSYITSPKNYISICFSYRNSEMKQHTLGRNSTIYSST